MFVPSIKKLMEREPTEGLRICSDTDWELEAFTAEEREDVGKWVRENRLFPEEAAHFKDPQAYGWNERLLWEYQRMVSETRCAWCWFAAENESATMWQLYGQGGVAVRSSLSCLESVLVSTGKEWIGSRINYLERGCPLDPAEEAPPDVKEKWVAKMKPWIRRPFLAKRIEYRDEHEVRFVTINSERGDGHSFTLPRPEAWIEAIVFWGRIPESEVASLKEFIGSFSPRLAERTRRSQLWERDPSLQRSDFIELCKFDGNQRRAKEAEKWPQLLRNL